MTQPMAWEWAAAGIQAIAWRAADFGHPREGDTFTEEHLAIVQRTESYGFTELAGMRFIQSRAGPMSVVVYLDRGMDLKTQLSIPANANVGMVKRLLAESDPTGQVDPTSFALKEVHPTAGAMKDSDPVPPGTRELELCAVPAPQEPAAPYKERKRVESRSIGTSQWEADCQVGFEMASPPRWEFLERDMGSRSIWSSLPDATNLEINAISRRGQRRGTIRLGGCELTIDLHDMVAMAAGPRAIRRTLRKHYHQPQINKRQLLQLYLRYADVLSPDDHPNGPDGIEGEGILELFEDLGVDPGTDVAALALSWACKAGEMGTFRRREFICGCALLEVDSLEGLRSKTLELREKLRSGRILPEVYAYVYTVALEPPSKVLPVEDARQYWALLLHDWPLLEDFCKWVEENMKGKAVNRDLWMMVLKLAREVPADLSTYDEDPAWPVAIDDFVEHYRALKGG